MISYRFLFELFSILCILLKYGHSFQDFVSFKCKKEIHVVSTTTLGNEMIEPMEQCESCSKIQCNLNQIDNSRRLVLNLLSVAPATGILPLQALAAPPMTLEEAEGIKARLERKLRVKVPKMLRPQLDQSFAVLLMRSSYNALDEIDCVPMDQFQRDFFLFRQAEYLPYVDQIGTGLVQQGMLTNPYYFDFISFAQYATISREINNSPVSVFEEQEPAEGDANNPQTFVTKVVRRDPSLSNRMLSTRHGQLVGKAIIDRLNETFQATSSSIPFIQAGVRDYDSIRQALTQLMKLFLVNGFALDGRVEDLSENSSGIELCVTMTNPANFWSAKALTQRRADPINSFFLKAAVELVTRSGLRVTSSSVTYENYTETTCLKIQYESV